METLHRSQVYLPEEQISLLKIEAKKTHTSVSELIRRAIDRFLTTKNKTINWNKDPLTQTIGKVALKVNDASVKHDDYLYK
jgi:hypothetical protein